MSKKYSSDKGMQKLFEGFRRSLKEGVELFDDEGNIFEDQLDKLLVRAAAGDKEAAKQLYVAADGIKSQGFNFSTEDGTPMNKDAIAKAYGLEVGGGDKAQTPQTPAVKNPIGNPELEKYFDEKTRQYDIMKYMKDMEGKMRADREKQKERYAKEKEELKATFAKQDAELKAKFAQKDKELADRLAKEKEERLARFNSLKKDK